jgi:hypothetical protein
MQKGITVIVWVIIVAVVLGGGYMTYRTYNQQHITDNMKTLEVVDTTNLKTYHNEELDFLFQYPVKWRIEETPDSFGVVVRAVNPAMPNVGTVTIIYRDNPEHLTGKQWFNKNVFKTEKEVVGEIVIDSVSALEILDSGMNTVRTVLIGKNNSFVSISAIAFPAELANKEIFDQILSTFKFTK